MTHDGRETVVLLHGLGRSPQSMERLGRRLEARGYRVVSVAYASRHESVEAIARHLDIELARRCPERAVRVHFVTHSLGSIVVRYYIKHHRPANLGRVVMLGPPNGGSELVDLMRRIPIVRHHMGPSRGQLGTDSSSLPARLGPVDFELGVIAGTRTWNPLFSWLLPGADDGMVTVERTKVEGMSDFLAVPRTHTFMMKGPDVIAQTIAFLRHGEFDHDCPDRTGA
ncbi:MAG TPA: alpha/beta fold hydrolase [Candidatus Polarisedimenticolia bacterium]|nr:alpha/beta fold hydrolase [Candidatus Polarisedimenticolia bacterium]